MSNKNADVLLHHMMERKEPDASTEMPIHGNQPDSASYIGNRRYVQMMETRIYVGLNNAETKEQKFETEKYLNILKDVCRNYHVAFSVDIEEGGYYHEDGNYTEENSFVLVLIDADRNTVQEIAKDLCTFFRQESVLVTENRVDGYFIYQEIAADDIREAAQTAES